MRNILLATAAITLIAAPAMAQDPGSRVTGSIGYTQLDSDGGDPSSIAFCEEVGLTYVSCSPYRVPIARLAAAQAALHARAGTEREKDR